MTFNARTATTFGQEIYLVGSISQLGSWNTANAILMSASAYTNANPVWSVVVQIPAGTYFEYKYVRKEAGAFTWDSGNNKVYTTPGTCTGTATINDVAFGYVYTTVATTTTSTTTTSTTTTSTTTTTWTYHQNGVYSFWPTVPPAIRVLES